MIPLLVLSSCTAIPLKARLAREDQGTIALYVQPFPQEADRLAFTITRITAVRNDGQEFELALRLPALNGELSQQRMLCEGFLPPGSYTGFSFQVGKAVMKGEDGEARLLVPEKPVLMPYPFSMLPNRSSVLFLSFNYSRSLQEGYAFSPAFTFFTPSTPVTALLGFVSESGSQRLSVLDKNAMQAVGGLAAGHGPQTIVLDQRQKRLYVGAADDDAITVFDAASLNEVNKIRLIPGDEPMSLGLTPDGRILVCVNRGSNSVSLIDTGTGLESVRITVGTAPTRVLVDRNGRRAYVLNTGSDTLSVVDLAQRSLVVSAATESEPLWAQLNAKGDRLYIIHGRSPYMTVLDPLRLAILSRVFVGAGIRAVKVDPATDLIYVSGRAGSGIDVYDPSTLVAFDHIDTAEGGSYLTIDADGNNLWMIGAGTPKLIVINLTSKKVVAEVEVGEEPSWLALMGER